MEECFATIRDIKDDLVLLYFRHIHAIFPIIDEYSFMQEYNASKDENELVQHIDLILIQAVMFAAFAVRLICMSWIQNTLTYLQHVNERQLKKTPHTSVHEGQKAMFNKLKVPRLTNISNLPCPNPEDFYRLYTAYE